MNDDFQRWKALASELRRAGAVNRLGDEAPPPGFATRVIARAREARGPARGTLFRWRRHALAAAAGSGIAYAAIALGLPEPEPQFLPWPALEFPPPAS